MPIYIYYSINSISARLQMQKSVMNNKINHYSHKTVMPLYFAIILLCLDTLGCKINNVGYRINSYFLISSHIYCQNNHLVTHGKWRALMVTTQSTIQITPLQIEYNTWLNLIQQKMKRHNAHSQDSLLAGWTLNTDGHKLVRCEYLVT